VAAQVSQIPGVEAVVLGGSYARGMQHADSDLDVGLCYQEERPFPVADIRRVAAALSTRGTPVVTDFYEWGPWVNGGAWIRTEITKVDLLYRNLDQVERTIREASEGVVQFDYLQQPPYGFPSVIYLAEVHACVPLHDPHGRVARLKEQVAVYPPKLKARLVQDFLWLAEFTLLYARGFAAASDIYNTAGCLTRVAMCLTQALFALNERYFITDKTALAEVAAFPLAPPGYSEELARILSHPGATTGELCASVEALTALWKSVVALAGSLYQSRFAL